MARLLAVLRIVVRRSLANWRLLATVAVGVLLAAALMSTVVLYSDTVRDLGLRHALEEEDPFALDIQVYSSSQPMNAREFTRVRDTVEGMGRGQAGAILEGTARFLRSATFFPTAPGVAVDQKDENRPRGQFQWAQDIRSHVRLVAGAFPRTAAPPASPDSAPTVEVMVHQDAAARGNVSVGQEFDLHPFWRPEVEPVHIVVTGIFETNDPAERYWFRKPERYDGSGTNWLTLPFFVADEKEIIGVVASYLADMDGSLDWYGFVEVSRINSRNANDIEARLRGLAEGLRTAVPRTSVQTELPDTISTFRTHLFFTRLPLFALMLQIVGIVLYYLVMVATMLQERQVGEIALLRSRGASIYQVVGIAAIEGAMLCGAAAVVGPFVAQGGIAVLGLTPPFEDLSHGHTLHVPLSTGAFLMALAGAGLAFAALLWPAYQAAKKTMIDYKQQLARPEQQPVFLRYYLDLVLIGAAAFAFYQLRQHGSLVTERLFGGLSADPLLLISPTLFMLMVALVFIRLFPLGLRFVAWAVAGLSGPTIALGMWRMVRSPLHYSRLILLLLLATAVGMFAAGYRATLERGYDDRAGYESAAPARLENIRTRSRQPTPAFVSAVGAATGAATVSPAVRLEGSYNPTFFRTIDVNVLGVVPAEAKSLLFWRDDFAGDSLGKLLSRIAPEAGFKPGTGRPVPAGARLVGVWSQFPLNQNIAQPWVRLRDSTGNYWEYRLVAGGPVQPNTWQFFAADLSRPSTTRPPGQGIGEATLDSVFIRVSGPSPPFPERVTVLLDDVQVTTRAIALPDVLVNGFSDGVVVEDFESDAPYELITGASSVGEPGSFSRADGLGRSGRYAARIAFTRQRGTPPAVGFRVREGRSFLPVVVDTRFLEEAKVKTGDEIPLYVNRQYVQTRIVGTFDLFPSYDPEDGDHLMVTDLDSLASLASRVPFAAEAIFPNEALLDGLPRGLDRSALEKQGIDAEHIFDRAALRAEQSSDPLVAASWEGILFLSFAAILALTALGFAVYAVLAAKARALEFAILRTMGYSPPQILGLVSFEQCFVIGAGVAVGTVLGFPLGRLMIDYLGVTESGRDPLPPLVAEVSWLTVGTVYSLLAFVFVATIAMLSQTYSRLAVARALRIGEI